jgi:hypothetical protein
MQIISAHTPKHTENGGVELVVMFAGIGEVPFHATPSDSEAHGRQLYTRAMQGEFGEVAPYQAPVVSLEDAKAAKLARIRAARHAVEYGGMMHDGVMYDSDATARAKYSETARVFDLMPEMVVEGWKASDGQDGQGFYVTMTQALLDALTLAGAQHDAACFAWERERAAEVAAAETVEEVEAVSEVMG